MYTLAETMKIIFGLELEGEGRFFCMEIDHDRALLSNRTQGMASCYSFNLITAGSMTLHYNGSVLTLNVDDLYTYAPGQPVTMLSASDDLHYYVLLVEESLTLESSAVRNIVRAAYRPLTMLHEPKIHLSPADSLHLQTSMKQIIYRLGNPHPYCQESLRLSLDLFLLDMLQAQEQSAASQSRPSSRYEELFFRFVQLLPVHFLDHRDIAYYASLLSISPVYLSRIVRHISGHTVADYINQMLLMEASFLLRTTTLSVSQIADRLHFASSSSFCKFFLRTKGETPRQFRNR